MGQARGRARLAAAPRIAALPRFPLPVLLVVHMVFLLMSVFVVLGVLRCWFLCAVFTAGSDEDVRAFGVGTLVAVAQSRDIHDVVIHIAKILPSSGVQTDGTLSCHWYINNGHRHRTQGGSLLAPIEGPYHPMTGKDAKGVIHVDSILIGDVELTRRRLRGSLVKWLKQQVLVQKAYRGEAL